VQNNIIPIQIAPDIDSVLAPFKSTLKRKTRASPKSEMKQVVQAFFVSFWPEMKYSRKTVKTEEVIDTIKATAREMCWTT